MRQIIKIERQNQPLEMANGSKKTQEWQKQKKEMGEVRKR
jgi:hypothetical protein